MSSIVIDLQDEILPMRYALSRKQLQSDDKDTASLGTVGYAAPEQYGISQSGKSTDIYALGVLLNIMITGVHPAINSPKGPIKHIIQKATNVQISRRYQSAKEMQKELRLYI